MKRVRVKFTANGQVAGVAYRPGDEAELDQATAAVYVATRQAEFVSQETAEPDTETPKKRPPRKTVKRAGKPAETATADDREKR